MTQELTPSDASPNVTRTLEGTPTTDHLERIARAAQAHAGTRADLEAAMRDARRERVPLRAIADASGFSPEQVRRLTTTEGAPQ